MNIREVKNKNDVIEILNENSLTYEECDITLAIYENNKVVGTISSKDNIIKMFAISKHSNNDTNGAALMQAIENRLLNKYNSFFVFTSSQNEDKFAKFGYKLLVEYKNIVVLEKGTSTIKDFVANLSYDGAIVMNANPFTKGHKYLVEQASKNCNKLVIFVVETNLSSFDFETRFKLVKEGTKEFKNVTVLPSGNYMVSQITFPTYFLKDNEDINDIQQNIDAHIFGKWFSKVGIQKRFVGTEPFSQTTRRYNETLKKVLPQYNIELIEIERLQKDGKAISASEVRSSLLENNIENIKNIVPENTYKLITSDKQQEITERLKNAKNRH